MEFAGSCQNPTSEARGAGTYIYTPLEEERSIRLIRLHPATDPDTPLRCTITTRPLANGVSFEALSYQWGDPDRTHTLFCDNVPLGITTSLYKALINLRPKDTYALFWADAVCINQDDLTEKAIQVTFMAEIYKAAQRTVVYLGDQSDDTALAIKSLKQIATICMEASGERFDHINRVVDEETQTFLDRVDHARMNTLYTSDERILAAFRTFFGHGWWNRIWAGTILLNHTHSG
ncbi:hypothetical protein PFICI_04112 [Pestalotiopsis fici W106-1]|uniref:Heterokaryon incompatibility domain-containing protein n=1 Tax=Pestalotiopsis fici (strain W106-1 / CGMCC3.15140) TaxID=1229662 RepID=W3XKU3_PESFW|nr:uncharacterized protein PFICI_04112 [Pestalotiopsis fici W106-1]ETS86087.1 hypothetical protein PFICI_04112 [Pestalotiopsis fici W106-1]